MTEIREFATWGVDEPLRVRKWVPLEEHEAEVAARDQTIKDLGFQLGMAEEGLANYAQELAHLHSTLAHRLQELDDVKWLIRNGEKHFGSLWRDATAADIATITRRPAEPHGRA